MNGHTIISHGDHRVDLATITPDDIRENDIIWHLSNLTRWTGALNEIVTVANHCLYMDDLIGDYDPMGGDMILPSAHRRLRKIVLWHDAAEAYLGEIRRGVKECLPMWRKLEAHVQGCVWQHLGMGSPTEAEADFVKRLDDQSALREALQFGTPAQYASLVDYHEREAPPLEFVQRVPPCARQEFRARIEELGQPPRK